MRALVVGGLISTAICACASNEGRDGSSCSAGEIEGEAAIICDDGTSSVIRNAGVPEAHEAFDKEGGLGGLFSQPDEEPTVKVEGVGGNDSGVELCEIHDADDGGRIVLCRDGTQLSVTGEDKGYPLIESRREYPGENCSAGGQLIRVGHDDNGDGQLQNNEETDATYVCELHVIVGDVSLRTQNEVAAYKDVRVVTGSLTIEGSDINDLSPLESLGSVGGDLLIRNNEQLTHLVGLDKLSTIRGDFYLEGNSQLSDFEGLGAVQTIVGSLYIRRNAMLLSFHGFESLASVGSELSIWQNNQLVDFQGMQALFSVGGRFDVQSNPALVNSGGLDSFAVIEGGLVFFDNLSLSSLVGLEHLEAVGADFYLGTNPSLLELGAVARLTRIGGDLVVENHERLPNCAAEQLKASVQEIAGMSIFVSNNGTDSCATK